MSVSSWSLHRELPHFLRKEVPGKISLMDLPELCIKEFGVDVVELCQMHFLSTDQDYVEQVKDVLDPLAVKVVNIPVDIGYAAEPDREKRRADFEIIKHWFGIAKYLGSPSIRVNTGEGADEGALRRAIEGYKELVRTAEEMDVKLLIENHGGISENPDNIIRIMQEVKSHHLRICPDFGNFPPEMRYDGLEKLAEYASIVHVKTYEFDERGEETTIDIKRCVDILRKKGFDGYYSIEFGAKGDQREGVKKSLALLRKYLPTTG